MWMVKLDVPKILIYLSSPVLVIGLFLWAISACERMGQEKTAGIINTQSAVIELNISTDTNGPGRYKDETILNE